MKMFVHSSFGVLDCEPMTLQAIEKSIPESEATAEEANQLFEAVQSATVEACSNGLGSFNELDDPENNEGA